MIISVGIGWKKIPGSSSRNPPEILPFLIGVSVFLENPTRNRGGGSVKTLFDLSLGLVLPVPRTEKTHQTCCMDMGFERVPQT
jgi:hypothetical protein